MAVPATLIHDKAVYYDVVPDDLGEGIGRQIVRTLTKIEFEIKASHHEAACGQHEIDFKYADALTAADNIVTFKYAVKAVASQNGLHSTFIPKPILGINASGMLCNRERVDEHIKIAELALLAKDIKISIPSELKTEKIAIIGSGVAGLSCVFHLRKKAYNVKVFEADDKIGGKLSQVIPHERLPKDILQSELQKLSDINIQFQLKTKINKKLLAN